MKSFFCGMTVSPKTGELCLVWAAPDGRRAIYVTICSLAGDHIGQANIVGIGSSQKVVPPETQVTGFMRAHSDGVEEELRSQGFGTALYCGLACAAYVNAAGEHPAFKYEPRGAGACSLKNTRSKLADNWWTGAKERELAFEQTGYADDVIDAEVSGTAETTPSWLPVEDVMHMYAGKLRQRRRGRAPSRPIPMPGDRLLNWFVAVMVAHNHAVTADALPWERAWEKNIVVAQVVIPPPNPTRAVCLPITDKKLDAVEGFLELVNGDAIAAANYGVLHQYGKRGAEAMQRMLALGKNKGLTSDQLNKMRARYEAGADIEWEVLKKPRRPFAKNASVVLYGARPNPDREVMRDMEELVDQRRALGWDEWADDES